MPKIPLTNRNGDIVAHALVDRADVPLVSGHRWHLDGGGGSARHSWQDENGKICHVRMHRLILGEPNARIHVDHRNMNPLDNRRRNLRRTTQAQNRQNLRNYKNSRSKYRGVHWRKDRSHWVAIGTKDGKSHYIGSSSSEAEAGKIAKEWRRKNLPYSEENE